jgi:hypothetical protein
MASETDIRKMLVEALRPSLLEAVQQQLAPLAEVKTDITKIEAALRQRIDEVAAKLTGTIGERIDAAFKDMKQRLDQELDLRLSGLESQFVLNQTTVNALGDELRRSLAQASDRADRVHQRLAAAAAALREELPAAEADTAPVALRLHQAGE